MNNIETEKQRFGYWIWAGLLLVTSIWSFLPDIKDLFFVWRSSDEYSSGMLVPVIAGSILYSRIKNSGESPAIEWLALPLLFLAQLCRLAGVLLMSSFLTRAGLLVGIYSLLLLLLGRKLCLRNYAIFFFLVLMIPLPISVHSVISPLLQHWATQSAVFFLEMLGYQIVTEGNIININGTSVAVAEACNGLRMITAFFVTSGLIALIVNRSSWQKIVVVVSTLPIALVCNTIRLVITSIAFTMIDAREWEKLFHDFGGFAMMPLAVALVIAELAFMNMLIETDNSKGKAEKEQIVFKKVN
ncbi:MAG: exosortase/archaeosortase family protein [Sedimentisphaerales bacterium]|nr:exosortase/archaeosortase family protein [Sedimentisphaerales bacterium]MBN2843244.1 exosortase/archaeosortase family protein [Sedimentisphaerales bacterium]